MSSNNNCKMKIFALLVLICLKFHCVDGVLETSAIDVSFVNDGSSSSDYSLLVSQGWFGTIPKMSASNNEKLALVEAPSDNPLLCDNVTSSGSSSSNAIMLVPRGVCSFEQKAYIAQNYYGVNALLIYGTLGSRYTLNATNTVNNTDYNFTMDDIVYPQQYYDYDCNYGTAQIEASKIVLDNPLPYNSKHNDPLLSGETDDNLCLLNSKDHLATCPSKACLLTGKTIKSDDVDYKEACCAWDLPIYLYPDSVLEEKIVDDPVTIPVAYLTMNQGQKLLNDSRDTNVFVTLYSRYRPQYNSSFFLIWSLGVFVAAVAAYMSANDYRKYIEETLYNQRYGNNNYGSGYSDNDNNDSTPTNSNRNALRDRENSNNNSRQLSSPQNSSSSDNENQVQQQYRNGYSRQSTPDDSLELNAWHAIGFVIMASSGLLILFFFKIYSFVKVLYAVGCSKAISQVILLPLCTLIGKHGFGYKRDKIVWRTNIEDIGDITVLDIISHVIGYTLGTVWLILCFKARHPEEIVFYWVMQDIMGACMCVTFLETIKLNSIRVASILLVVAFFYDIFFVFVTPMIFKGESVMITVATSGGPPKADPAWCEKYPDDANCQGGDPLPMLLTVPRIGDYQGGSSLLGLGDIVLPGLLLSFGARYDSAKSMLGIIGGNRNGSINSSYSCPEAKGYCQLCTGGYYPPLVVAYAAGLLMANSAVYIMNMGQPALLYLVPCCLGTMVFMGWRRNELKLLWEGPRIITTADNLIYNFNGNNYDDDTNENIVDNNNPINNDNKPEDCLAMSTTTSDTTLSANGDVDVLLNTSGNEQRVDIPLLSSTTP